MTPDRKTHTLLEKYLVDRKGSLMREADTDRDGVERVWRPIDFVDESGIKDSHGKMMEIGSLVVANRPQIERRLRDQLVIAKSRVAKTQDKG